MGKIKIIDLFRHKQFLMGLAGLWILYYHSNLQLVGTHFKNIGYGGVDIFLFLSGIGCYCSLKKNSDPASFIYRRIKRIVPTYLLCFMLWLIVDYFVKFKGVPMKSIIGNIFGVQILCSQYEYTYAWYVMILWLCYFLAPVFKAIVDSIKSQLYFWGLLLLIVLISFSFWREGNLILVFSRVPIYFVGIYAGKIGYDGCAISRKFIVASAVGLILGGALLYMTQRYLAKYLWSYGLYWYPFIIVAPLSCLLISYFLEINKEKRIVNLINNLGKYFGKYSFEMYLIQLIIFEIVKNEGIFKQINIISENTLWIISMIAVIGISIIIHDVVDRLCKTSHV